LPASPAPAPRAFDAAVDRVRTAPEHFTGASVDDVRTAVGAIAQAILAVAGGQEAEISGIPVAVSGRRVLEAIRQAYLEELAASSAAPAADELLATLRAIEGVQRALDGDAAQRFVSRLDSADALQLVVEVAHDMRSPLNAILFLTEQIRNGRSGSISPMQERQVGLVYSAAFGLSALVSDVIELAHTGNTLVDRSPGPFSISSVLHSVNDIVRPLAEEKGLTVQMTGTDADLRVGHPVALSRVLLNLTTNALKFTERGSVSVTCESKSRTRVEFSIQDTGRGIPQSVLATLFDAFRRRQGRADFAFSSAGLGLSICRQLVADMGGELRVETELERGTRFSFELTLPVAPRISGATW
jgi:signal transduction histidine kinase